MIDFKQLTGSHSGKNMARAVLETVSELGLQEKLFTITGDNASNNDTMVTDVYNVLKEDLGDRAKFLYPDGYVRCLAHILNLVVKEILYSLKSGSCEGAQAVCDSLDSPQGKDKSPFVFPMIEVSPPSFFFFFFFLLLLLLLLSLT